MSDIKHTPLEAAHLALGARLVPFAGWNMPVQYTAIIEEHHAVRQQSGIFDISHMGQIFVDGPRASLWLNTMLTNQIDRLEIGQGQYSLMLNQTGGVIDDLIVYRAADEEYLLVVNASMIEEDIKWLIQHQAEGVNLRNESDAWAGMAIQGPQSVAVFQKSFPGIELPPRNGILKTNSGHIICRTGYTGEDGFEFFCPANQAITVWNQFIEAGAAPCGLGARDTLRLEMCYPLNGNDLSPLRSPIEAGLGFFCDLTKNDFIGKTTLDEQKKHGTSHRLTAIQYTEKGAPPRAHYPVVNLNGDVIGELSSGVLSPSLMTGIGMAYLPTEYTSIGTEIGIHVRGRIFPAKVTKKPFYKPNHSL